MLRYKPQTSIAHAQDSVEILLSKDDYLDPGSSGRRSYQGRSLNPLSKGNLGCPKESSVHFAERIQKNCKSRGCLIPFGSAPWEEKGWSHVCVVPRGIGDHVLERAAAVA